MVCFWFQWRKGTCDLNIIVQWHLWRYIYVNIDNIILKLTKDFMYDQELAFLKYPVTIVTLDFSTIFTELQV